MSSSQTMSTLNMTLSGDTRTITFAMNQVPPRSGSVSIPGHAKFTFVSVNQGLHSGDSTVFRGTLSCSLRKYDGPTDVVCKLVASNMKNTAKCLEHEANLYCTKLAPLQGSCVPQFIGYFTGKCSKNDASYGCILMEYCGEAVPRGLNEYPLNVRLNAYHALRQIHMAGVEHCDTVDRLQVVVQGEEARIIDFGLADNEHVCKCRKELYPYDFQPPFTEYPCEELFYFAITLDLWTSLALPDFLQRGTSLRGTRSLNGIVSRGMKKCPGFSKEYVKAQAIRELDRYYARYKDRWDVVFGSDDDDETLGKGSFKLNPDPKIIELRHKLAWLRTWGKDRRAPPSPTSSQSVV